VPFIRLAGTSTPSQMMRSDVDGANCIGQFSEVKVREDSDREGSQENIVAPMSVNIYRFPVVGTAQ